MADLFNMCAPACIGASIQGRLIPHHPPLMTAKFLVTFIVTFLVTLGDYKLIFTSPIRNSVNMSLI